ncbi:MAG: ring-hydroxylating oxygenase subunit alpha [Gammaproteobacteria bacterium]|nr:ring-hydroxylating oxygenase subunit alpha [Gammaproteobacteria bacterium]
MDTKNFNNLETIELSSPASFYLDSDRFDQELQCVWFRNWIFAAHISDLPEIGDFLVSRIGDQEIIIVRTESGIRGYFNTCRHRGSALCAESVGHFHSGSIRCPYHHWTYSLEGELVQIPRLDETVSFSSSSYPLYSVATQVWEGCIFFNLAVEPLESLPAGVQPTASILRNWNVASLSVAHRFETTLDCNWKIIWENFLECYHCPGVHRELSSLVPIYQRTFMEPKDERDWDKRDDRSDPRFSGGMSEGNFSWTIDGQLHGERFPDLTEEEFDAGYVYAQHLPSMFIVGHPDYVRLVWFRPLSPTKTVFSCYWLLSQASLEKADLDLASIVDFGLKVIEEDARVCELNQRGLSSLPHLQGLLVPQEYDVLNFQKWVESQVQVGAVNVNRNSR